MRKILNPGILNGTIFVPPSKSFSQRAILAASLAKGKSAINNLGEDKDSQSMICALQSLGVSFIKDGNTLLVDGGIDFEKSKEVSVGESGLAARLMMPILSLSKSEFVLSGTGTILNRKMNFTEEVFEKLGVSVTYTSGSLPMTIKGPIVPCSFSVDCSQSSQFLSGLLYALPMAASNSTICADKLASKPYIKMTLDVLNHFGITIETEGDSTFKIRSNQLYLPTEYTVEGDWSGASTFLVSPGRKTIRGLNPNSLQADKNIIVALKKAGLNVIQTPNDITVYGNDVKPFTFDATDCPDLFPALAILAVRSRNGKSELIGTSRLINKESNRLLSIRDQFQKMGIFVDISHDNKMVIEGGQHVRASEVYSCSDHRIAMALASLSLMSDGTTVIDGAESVNKSYKNFWNDFNLLYSYE